MTRTEYHRQWRAANREKYRAYHREYGRKHRVRLAAQAKARGDDPVTRVREWRKKNLEHRRKYERQYRAKNKAKIAAISSAWTKRNAGQVNAYTALRRASKANATPKWLTDEQRRQMKAIYSEAKRVGGEVDHIVPLNGETFCGLHVPWNLQILPRPENRRKGNRL